MGLPDPIIGRKLGDYTILALLGKGGMARVYKGYDEALDRHAAVKVITSDFVATADEVEYKERFQREARAIARLRHPNIVGIYQFGDLDGLYYMAMVFLDGEDLRIQMKKNAESGQQMQYADVLKMAREVASALDYAHSQGVIHRDIKPSNIMMTSTGATLTDFGLALSTMEGTAGDTFGSAHYIAPEQAISSARAVPQSDLYSLGVVLYEAFTGKVPFDDPSVMSVALKHLNEPPPRPTASIPNFPSTLEDVLLRVLSKDPDNRYANGKEFVQALHQALPFEGDTADMTSTNPAPLYPSLDLGITGSKPSQPAGSQARFVAAAPTREQQKEALSPPTQANEKPEKSPKKEERDKRSFPILWIAMVGILLLIGIGIGFVVFGGNGSDADNNSAETDQAAIAENANQTATAVANVSHMTQTAVALDIAQAVTEIPTEIVTEQITQIPTEIVTEQPTERVTALPTEITTQVPTEVVTQVPTEQLTEVATEITTQAVTQVPTEVVTEIPTQIPTEVVTQAPTEQPTEVATEIATQAITQVPTEVVTEIPTQIPTEIVTQVATAPSTEQATIFPIEEDPDVELRYDEGRLVLENISGTTLNLSTLAFEGNVAGRLVADVWEQAMSSTLNASMSRFNANGCVQAVTSNQYYAQSNCRWYNVWLPLRNSSNHFWTGANTSFSVYAGSTLIGLCDATATSCQFSLDELDLSTLETQSAITETATPSSEATPTSNPEIDNPDLELRYTSNQFLMENVSGRTLDLTSLRFEGETSRIFNASSWNVVLDNVGTSLARYANRGCVLLLNGSASNPARPCLRYNVWLRSSTGINDFWSIEENTYFDVRYQDNVIARCISNSASNEEVSCSVSLSGTIEETTPAATAIPTEMATEEPDLAAEAPEIILRYNNETFLVQNIGDESIDLSQFVFEGDTNGRVEASLWSASLIVESGSLDRFESQACLQIALETDNFFNVEENCTINAQIRRSSTQYHFWFDIGENSSFTVANNATVMVACPIAESDEIVECRFRISDRVE